jgi:hypothetical protein
MRDDAAVAFTRAAFAVGLAPEAEPRDEGALPASRARVV